MTVRNLVSSLAEVANYLELALLISTGSIADLHYIALRVTQVLVDQTFRDILGHRVLSRAAISKFVFDYFLGRFNVVRRAIRNLN